MLKTTLNLAAVALALLLSTAVSAQSLQYLGPHSTAPLDFVDGDQGVLRDNDLCDATFAGAQMCASVDILRGGGLPDASFLIQWVNPTLISAFIDGANVVRVVDASGVVSPNAEGLGCPLPFTTGSPAVGLTVSTSGRYSILSCESALPIACCRATKAKK